MPRRSRWSNRLPVLFFPRNSCRMLLKSREARLIGSSANGGGFYWLSHRLSATVGPRPSTQNTDKQSQKGTRDGAGEHNLGEHHGSGYDHGNPLGGAPPQERAQTFPERPPPHDHLDP